MQRNPFESTEVVSSGSATGSHYNISWEERKCGNVVMVRVFLTPTADSSASYVEVISMSNLKFPPYAEIIGAINLTIAPGDLTPTATTSLNENKNLRIRGSATNGRTGITNFTYLI